MNYSKKLEKWRKRREGMKKMLSEGKTQAEIARCYKISRQRVNAILGVPKDY